MKELNEIEIMAVCPLLYEDKVYPGVGDGWYRLVKDLSVALEKEIKEYKNAYPDLDCETCGCPKEEHYGYMSWRPGKCLVVKKVGKYQKWGSKRFKFRPKWLASLLTWMVFYFWRARDKILNTFFYKYQTCWCEQYRHPHPRASQIKEKFGGLRFYMTHATDKMYDLINEAERKSYTTCEVCGAPGEERGGGWIRTLCDECNKK
jgi:hypothetical protein